MAKTTDEIEFKWPMKTLDKTHAVDQEIFRAIQKHGFVQTPMNPNMGSCNKLAVLVEEVGEVATAMTYDRGSKDDLMEELLQVAAMAYAWYLSIEAEG